MRTFFSDNWGTILVGLAVIAVVAAVVRVMLRDRKQGKNSCGCNCAHCASAGMCHKSVQSRG